MREISNSAIDTYHVAAWIDSGLNPEAVARKCGSPVVMPVTDAEYLEFFRERESGESVEQVLSY